MSNITRYRVWPDGDVQEADTPAHHWKSDDYELVEAPTPEDAWARAKANAPMVPELNYAALCDAAFLQDKRWVQGTAGCVAFTLGAEWYRDQLLATGLHTLYKTNDPEAPATIRDRNGEVVLSLCKVCGKAEGELGEPCHAPAVPQGFKPVGYLRSDEFDGYTFEPINGEWPLGELLFSATPAPAPAQEVATPSLAAEDVHAAFTKNFPKSRISQAWINFAADIAQAIAARAAKPEQEAGLTDEERQQVFRAAENRMVHEINLSWRNAVVDEVIAALRAKGQS